MREMVKDKYIKGGNSMREMVKDGNTGDVKGATAVALVILLKHNIIDANPIMEFVGIIIIMVMMAAHVRDPHSKPATRVYMWLLCIAVGGWWLLGGNGLAWLGSIIH